MRLFKKAAALTTVIGNLIATASAYAVTPNVPAPTVIIFNPGQGVDPNKPLAELLSQIITLVFSIAGILVLVMLIWGAINWILSAGEKEKVENARKRIINALVGLAILALAFLIAQVVGRIVGINVFRIELPVIGRPIP